jgi:hypothetical protein
MSTAFYPTNMRRQSTNGYSNGSTINHIPYVSWKGTGVFSNPKGITSNHIRPLTNNDPGNAFTTGFGLPRPLKHYRKGTIIPLHDTQLDRVINRSVKSSKSSSLGGGVGMISQMMEIPGAYSIKENNITNKNECIDCKGAEITSDWMPIANLTEKPQSNVTNPLLCCNQQRKALTRTLPTSTNLKDNYYQTNHMYLYNRCQTFKQRQFNFVSGSIDKKMEQLFMTYPFVTAKILEHSKPGDPLSIINLYVAQCNPNTVIDKSIESGFINSLLETLFKSNYITESEYNQIINEESLTTQKFITSLQNILTNEEYNNLIDYLYKLAANPYNERIVSSKKGCSQVYYKPNNPQFAKQGGVSSSTRTLKLVVDTINTSSYKNKPNPSNISTAIQYGFETNTPFIYKDKVPKCNLQTYIGNPFFFQGQHPNKNLCKSIN